MLADARRSPSVSRKSFLACRRFCEGIVDDQGPPNSSDCGLKTRKWQDVRPALIKMVAAAKQIPATLR
ncbi:MAG TPA: hypothetical protein VGC77_14610 [Rhodopseudomonas sp.]